MKEFFKYRRGAAIGALVLIIIVSVFAGVNRTVAVRRNAVEKQFTASDGSAAADLRSYAEYAGKLCAIASSVGCDTGRFESALAGFSYDSPFSVGKSFTDVINASDTVYAELAARLDSGDVQMRSAKSYYAEMNSTVMRLKENSGYNKAASRYNKAIGAFPANILAGKNEPAAVFDK